MGRYTVVGIRDLFKSYRQRGRIVQKHVRIVGWSECLRVRHRHQREQCWQNTCFLPCFQPACLYVHSFFLSVV